MYNTVLSIINWGNLKIYTVGSWDEIPFIEYLKNQFVVKFH